MKNHNLKLEMVSVCETHGVNCGKPGYVQDVGHKTHLFCCKNGFIQSLLDFQESLKPNPERDN